MIVKKLDHVIELLTTREGGGITTSNGDALYGELRAIREGISRQQLQEKTNAKQLELFNEGIDQMRRLVDAKTARTIITHKNHLHKGIWVSVGLFVVLVFLIWGWLNTYSKLEQYQGNDIKYRYCKVYVNRTLNKFCAQTDSIYLKDKSAFRDGVEQEEQRLIRQLELNRLAGEKKREAKTLREQAGHK